MPLTIEIATRRIGQKMQLTEQLTDETTRLVAELYTEILNAGTAFRDHEAGRFAQPALLRAQKALADMTAARGELARTHSALKEARKITMSPAEEECPEWVMVPVATDVSVAA